MSQTISSSSYDCLFLMIQRIIEYFYCAVKVDRLIEDQQSQFHSL